MSTTYIEAQSVRAHIERLLLSYPELADDDLLRADMVEGSTELNELLTRIVREERDAASFSEAIGAQVQALLGRRGRFERRKEALRALIMSLLDTAGQRTIRLPEATLAITNGRPGCVVTDEAALPDEFVKIERTPKKKEITTALQLGKDIPGAALRNSPPSLQVRVN